MIKKAQNVEVSTIGKDKVYISQESGDDHPAIVELSIDQLDQVIVWLEEARTELRAASPPEIPDIGSVVVPGQRRPSFES